MPKSTMELLRECESMEIERLFGQTDMRFVDRLLLERIYNRVNAEYRSAHNLGLSGCYLAGFVYGIRAERKRRREGKRSYTSINHINDESFTYYKEVKVYE